MPISKNALHVRVFAALALLMTLAALLPVAMPAADAGRLAGQPVAVYRERRQKLLEQVKDGVIVLVGAREEDFGEVGRFRQKNDFMYLTGVTTPAAYLMLVPAGLAQNKEAQEVIFIPPRNPHQERWTGIQLGPGEEAARKFGAQEVASAQTFQDRLRELLAAAKAPVKIYTVIPRGPAAAMTREHLFIESLKKLAPAAPIEDVSRYVHQMRLVKSAAEIELLQKAIDITVEAHRDTALAIKPGVYEYQVQAALEYAFARNGAERPGFPSIVGSGLYSTILHYNENRKQIEAGDLIVVDIGAEYSYYTADITRTYPATGKFTPRQRAIYQLVLDAQRAAEKAFKPGQSSIGDLQRAATEVMRASPLRDQEGKTLEKYFIHGLGHWLGMDVHDVGSYGKIPTGAVFTIEPGIYIPDEKLGVRIEDDYLATETGLVKMSGKLASDPDEIERM
ncbi:MAG TPA: Xaa-Pro peptidase family protein, partial [Blastocatellia bacterium]|nr:Xaa-Pro peptidase family protein [Blastocatellia bacterium]